MATLQLLWFILLFVLLIGYAILDGFDLGVGMLHLWAKNDRERRVSLNAIGPVWDGNEVWLLTAGGALFAAFPAVYATVFSGFYLALMLLLVALIGRAVGMEFRSKVESPRWRAVWDVIFSVCSFLPALLLGVAFGNILRGIPLNATGDFTGTFLSLLNPVALTVGLVTVAYFAMHGALYLAHKTEGPMRARLAARVPALWAATVALYVVAAGATLYASPWLYRAALGNPLAYVLLPVALVSLYAIRPFAAAGRYDRAFAASSLGLGSLIALAAVGLFPTLVPALNDTTLSLTAHNASSTKPTLTAMLIIALIGMPLVIGYTFVIYRTFKGKVVLGEDSY